MATMKLFMLAAVTLALFAIVLTFSAPPVLAEGREFLQTEPEAETTELAEAQKAEPDTQKTWGKSPPWHRAPHHGHRGHHDSKKPHHDGKKPHHDGKKHPHHDGKKPYPSPPY